MRLEFHVGETEKHKVEFSWNQFVGTSRLAVDGIIIQKSGVQLSSPVKVLGKNDVAHGWKMRVPYAVTRTGWEMFRPFSYDYIDIQLIERWTTLVGSVEKHRVVIEKERERWCAGLRPQKYRVFVDEKLVKQCRGY